MKHTVNPDRLPYYGGAPKVNKKSGLDLASQDRKTGGLRGRREQSQKGSKTNK
ncbi:MAG: hypothetical protein NWE87_00175 [Candidatus Bathyarchaeota archaeon]|nr:hypothetical protein [Candidatus Bathyarchaeota archaeon]